MSLLRSECKDPQARETLLSLVGDGALLTGLLESDEPKVRKNAALLLGSLGLLQTAGSLFHAYEREQTLFVRSAYLTALSIIQNFKITVKNISAQVVDIP